MGSHGLNHVGHTQYLRLRQNLVASQAGRIAGTIEPLMMLEDGQGDRPGEVDALEDVKACLRMHLENAEFMIRELARLA